MRRFARKMLVRSNIRRSQGHGNRSLVEIQPFVKTAVQRLA